MTSQTNNGSAGLLAGLRLRNKLLIMIAPPLLAAMWFTATGVKEYWSDYADAGRGVELAEFSARAGALVHELQKERGASAGYLGSSGTEFGDTLTAQRRETDLKAAELREFLAQSAVTSFDPQLGTLLGDAVNDLDQLASTRSQISSLEMPHPQALAYYTGMNGKFLGVVTFLSHLAVSTDLTNAATAYANFLQSKERAGVERAVLTNAFVEDRLDTAMANRFRTLVNEQNTFMSVFRASASAAANTFFTETMDDRSVREVIRMRTVASQSSSGFGIDGQYWFEMATARINLLKQVEDWLAADFAARTTEFAARARAALIGIAMLAAAAFGGSLLLVIVFLRLILRQLGEDPAELLTVVDAIASGDLAMDLSTSTPATGVFAAMQSMQENLRERVTADQRALEESTRLRSALGSVQTNVMMADADGNIIYCNDTVLAMFRKAEADLRTVLPNFNANDLLGQNIDIFHKNPAHQRKLLADLSSTFEGDIEVAGRSFTVIANPVDSDDGQRLGTVVEWEDRTEEVRAEREIEQIVSAVSSGDLTGRIDMRGKTGFIELIGKGINEIVDKLSSAMLDFDRAAQSVRSGSEEIAQGNTNLGQRTEEQAASLEETTSSMAEITGAVRQTATSAEKANKLTASARDSAEQGGDVVASAIGAMEAITASSKEISDIIGTIDEIAFQTNLLALNASVEAARAGEQGRGFAVVASEVRNLASRSANAAKEIKDLIDDSVGKVENGAQLVNESGKTLQEIVKGVHQVSEIVADIAAASREQSTGIEEVNTAVTQMDEMTQQNAALVEEIAAASESMRRQSEELGALIGQYKTGSGSVAATRETGAPADRRAADRPWSDDDTAEFNQELAS